MNFNDALYGIDQAGGSKLWQMAESYLNCVAKKKYQIISIKDKKIEYRDLVLDSYQYRYNSKLLFMSTILKIISYATVLLPVIALIAKAVYRNKFNDYRCVKEAVVIRNNPYWGMFAVFNSTLSFLRLYEKGHYQGIKLDFGTVGQYYDPSRGPNWWEYYCEPISQGNISDGTVKNYSMQEYIDYCMYAEAEISRHEANRLINKYIKPKPHILSKVEKVVSNHLGNSFIIGVHYRGTDKKGEAPRIPYEQAAKEVQKQIKQLSHENYKVLVASDEQPFVEYMKKHFPGKIVTSDALRSEDGQPIHMSNMPRYDAGEGALVDSLLLSKSNILIRTSSCLSLWSTLFNPDMPVIQLNKRWRAYL